MSDQSDTVHTNPSTRIHKFATVESGEIKFGKIAVPDVQRFTFERESDVIAPRFLLLDGSNLVTFGLHHNFLNVVKKYAAMFGANVPTVALSDLSPSRYFLIGGHQNFYHFVTNYLTRAFYYRDVSTQADQFIVSSGLPERYFFYLEMIGIPRERTVLVDDTGFTKAPGLVVANLPHYYLHGLHGDAEAFAWLRTKLGVEKRPSLGRRIMLSRSRATYRRIANEVCLAAAACRLGFEVIHPEDMTTSALLDILADAAILVTPYGANATNSLFCSSRTVIVEMCGRSAARKLNTAFLAAVGGQRLVRVIGSEVGVGVNWAYRDIAIRPDDFDLALECALDYNRTLNDAS